MHSGMFGSTPAPHAPASRPHARHACVRALAMLALVLAACCVAPSFAAAAPVNDDYANAVNLVGDDPYAVALMEGSTFEANEQRAQYQTYTNTVWYTWTPTTTHVVALGTVRAHEPRGASSNVVLYTGASLATLTAVPTLATFNDRYVGDSYIQPKLARVQAGQQYKVQVWTSGSGGVADNPYQSVTIPAFDMFSNTFASAPIAQVSDTYNVGGLAVRSYGFIDGATREAGEPVHAGVAGGARTIWRRVSSLRDATVVMDTKGSEFDTVLGVYTGSSVGALTPIASNNDESGTITTSKVTVTLQAHVVYRVAISDTGSGSGLAVLSIAGPSGSTSNDDFATRGTYDLVGSWDWDFGYNSGVYPTGTLEVGEPATIGGATDTYWWTVSTPRTERFSFALEHWGDVGDCTGTDYNVEVFTGNTLGSLVLVGSRLRGSPFGYSFMATAGVPYTFRVSGVVAPPTCEQSFVGMDYATFQTSPDAFASALDISAAAGTDSWDEYVGPGSASLEVGEPAYIDGTDRTLWYKIVPTTSRTYTFKVGGYGQTSLHAFSGTTLGSLVSVGSSVSPPYPGKGWPETTVSFAAAAGTTYYVAVGGVGAVGYAEFESVAVAAPNDTFASSITLGPGPATSAGAALAATREPGEPTHTSGLTPAKSVWYSWTATSSRRTRIDLAGTVYSSSLGVYTGSSVNALTLVGRDDGLGAGTNQVTFDAVAGTTYHVAVSATQFVLNIDVSMANDKFSSANVIAGANGRTSGWNTGADRQPGEPSHAGNAAGGSIWYTWTAPSTSTASFDTSGSGIDTVIGVYTGASVEDLVGVAANDDAAAGGVQSRVTFPTVAGRVYRIAVEGKGDVRGSFVLRWRTPEANDMQAAPIAIAAAGGSVTSNMLGAGVQSGEPSQCATTCDATLWYDWTPSFSGIAGIRTSGASFDTVLAAYTGAPGALTLVASNDDYGGATTSRLRFAVTSGTTYRLQVAAKSAIGSGGFTIEANLAPSNDNFASATTVTGPTLAWTGHNFGATSEAGEPVHAGIAGGRSVWLKWVATSTGVMSVDTVGSEIDTLLGVYTGAAVGSLATIASDDNGAAPASRLTFGATSGTTYYIAVDGKAGVTGDLVVHVNVPTNDMLATPTVIVDSGFTPVAASTIGATREIGEPDFGWTTGDNSVWFQWSITTETSRVLTTGDNNVRIEVFGSTAFATLRPVDTFSQYGSATYRGRLPVGTYWVRASSTGHNFTLAAPPAPANDDVANAQVIAGAGPWAGDDSNAAGEGFEIDLGYRVELAEWRIPSTWFSWTAPTTAVMSFGVSGGRNLSVWVDSADRANMTRVDLSGSTLALRTFNAQAGTTYLLRAAASSPGAYSLQLSPAPANNAFASAQVLGDPIANRATTDITGATCEASEPNHAGVTCDASVWYRWTPSTTGAARISTVGSRVDTTVAMYTGATIPTLVQVGASAGPHSAFSKGAQFDVVVTASTTYYFAVSARSGQRGETALQVGMTPLGDDIATPVVIAGNSGSASGTTAGATVENLTVDTMSSGSYSLPAPDPPLISTVWVRFTPSYTGLARVETTVGFDASIDYYRGPSTGPTGLYLYEDGLGNIPRTTPPTTMLPVTAGQTYWIRIGDRCCNGSYWGTWSVSINQTPNDNFASAATFGATASRAAEFVAGGSTEAGEPNHGGAGDPRTYWWNWTAPTSTTVSFTTARSDVDTALGVYTGAAVGSLALVAQDNNSIDDDARVQFAAVAGTTYRIAVSAAGATYGSVALRRDAPLNDEIASATLLVGATASTSSTIANAGYDLTERVRLGAAAPTTTIWHYDDTDRAVVWYRWVAPATAPVAVTIGTEAQSITAFSGATPASLTAVNGHRDALPTSTRLTIAAVSGTTYWFAVGQATSPWNGTYNNSSLSNGIDPGEGVANLTIVQRPSNDDFAGAKVLGGWSATDTVNTTLATREIGEPDHSELGGRSVWYSWTSPSTGPASVSTVGSDFDTLLGVYTGATLGTLATVSTRDDYPISTRATVTFSAVAGTTYRIAVDGYRGASGTAVVGVNVRPPNDDFANGYVIDGDIARTSGYSINATVEGGEPNHAGAGTDTSVWWYWTPAASHAATIDTYGSDFDTVLGVYTGAAVGSLVAVASNDNTGGIQSRVTFAAVAGTTYRIAVGGAAHVGNVRIRVNPQLPLVPDLVSPIAGASSASRIGPFRARAHHQDVAVLLGIQVEVCDDVAAPADPWSANCTTGYQVATGPTLVGDGGTQDVSLPARMPAYASYRWRARTIDDAGAVSAWSAPAVLTVGTTQSVSVSTLGYADTVRDAGGVSFGSMLPGTPLSVGPAGSGQRIAGAALEITTDSDYGTRLLMRAADFSDGAGHTVPATSMSWRDHSGVGETMQQVAWLPFTTVDSQVEDRVLDGPTTYAYDLQVVVPLNAFPASYTGTTTVTAIAQP
jgi:hypothetical protein